MIFAPPITLAEHVRIVHLRNVRLKRWAFQTTIPSYARELRDGVVINKNWIRVQR